MSAMEFAVYAETATHRIEFLKVGQAMVVDKKTGNVAMVPYRTLVKDITDAVKDYGDEKTISVYLTLVKGEAWTPMYKPEVL